MKDIKDVDVIDLLKYVFSLKKIIIASIALCVGITYIYSNSGGISYRTNMKLRLPQYCSDSIINTAVDIARTGVVKDVNSYFDTSEVKVSVSRVKQATVINVVFCGDNQNLIKEYADYYQSRVISEFDKFVHDEYLTELQRFKCQNGSFVSLNELKDMSYYLPVEVIYSPDVIDKVDNRNIVGNCIKATFFAMFITIVCGAVRYLINFDDV